MHVLYLLPRMALLCNVVFQPWSAHLQPSLCPARVPSCSASVEDSGADADCLGPIPQAAFLLGLGIEARLQQLLANATPEQAQALEAGFRCAGGTALLSIARHEGMRQYGW